MKIKQVIAVNSDPTCFPVMNVRNVLTNKLPINHFFSLKHSRFNQCQVADRLTTPPPKAHPVTLILKEVRTSPTKLFLRLAETIYFRKDGKKTHLFRRTR